MAEAEQAFAGKSNVTVIVAGPLVQCRQVKDFRARVAPDEPFRRYQCPIMVASCFHACRSSLPSDGPHFFTVRFCADGYITDEVGRRVRFVLIAAMPVRRSCLPVLDAESCGAAFIVPVVVHVIQPGRPGHGHVDTVAVLHIRRAHDRFIFGQDHVDSLVGDGAAEERYRGLVVHPLTRGNLHIAEVLDGRMPDTDVVDAFDRPIATAVQDVQVLVVLVLVIAVRRLDVIHEELRRRDTFAERLADDAAFLGLHVRQFPAIGRRALVVNTAGCRLVEMENAVDDFPAEDHDGTGRQGPQGQRRPGREHMRGRNHETDHEDGAQDFLKAPTRYVRQDEELHAVLDVKGLRVADPHAADVGVLIAHVDIACQRHAGNIVFSLDLRLWMVVEYVFY